jgi:RNA polymerase sigma-70 factor (ECF subfamily)
VNLGGAPLSDADWQALYRRLERPLFNLAYRYVWQREAAQDVVHDAFLRVWTRRSLLRAQTADRYLWVSTLNGARNARRWRKLRGLFEIGDAALETADDGHSPESAALHTERQHLLRAAIDALPEKLREVLLLAQFSGMRYEAIAALLGVPAGTVASRRHLAVERLRNHLHPGELP